MEDKIYSLILVFLQFLIIVIILILNDSIFSNKFSIFITLIGLVLGIYTLTFNKLGNFNITPEIKKGAILITTGTYKYIRHPMYFVVLLIMFAVIISSLNILSILLYFCLIYILYLKAKKEETLCLEKYEEYFYYKKRTKMFIPFIL